MADSLAHRARGDMPPDEGILFPADEEGGRSTVAAGRQIVADALRPVAPEKAAAVAAERDWRGRYPQHLRTLVACSLEHPSNAIAIARAGLDSAYRRFEFARGGRHVPLARATSLAPAFEFGTAPVQGRGDARPAPFAVPLGNEWLSGDRLLRQLERWELDGVLEPSHAEAVRQVQAHPDWLDLSDRCFVLLGAGAEAGPLAWLTRWRARIAAVDVARPATWQRLVRVAHEGNATLVAPQRPGTGESGGTPGADLLTELPELARWIVSQAGPLTVGAYAYLDGAHHVRVSLAMDSLMRATRAARPDVSLAALATPTDVYAVPEAAVHASKERFARRPLLEALWRKPVQLASGRRFFQSNYGTVAEANTGRRYGICDCLVTQQGPNYALAKRLQQWRALAAREDGTPVSLRVAPSTTTRSVISNRALAAAFAASRSFGVEPFAPETTRALMAAQLVHDLRNPRSSANPSNFLAHPLELFMDGANHGGMWRMPFAARSALPFAAAFGWFRAKPAGGQQT